MHPVYISYVGFPLLMLISRVSGIEVPRNIIDVYWVFLLAASMPALVHWVMKIRISYFYLILYFSLLSIICVKFTVPWIFFNIELVPYLMSAKPVFYFFVAIGAFLLFCRQDEGIFVRAGVALSLIIVFEFIFLSISHGDIVRPRGSGEINYDACLILLSLIVLKNYCLKNKKSILTILLVGLLFTFSRTAILTALVLYLIFERKHYLFKVFASSLAAVFFISSYLIRGLSIDSLEQYDRIWMWVSAFNLFKHQPLGVFFGFLPGVNLVFDVPLEISGLWDYQAAVWGGAGVYSYNFHSFWLRIVIDYGFLFIVFMLGFMAKVLFKHTTNEKMLMLFLAMQGLTMGLFYLGNISVVMIMYIFTIYEKCNAKPLVNERV